MAEEYPEFQPRAGLAPGYTVVDRQEEGDNIITTVIMGGQAMEFVTTKGIIQAGKDYVPPTAEALEAMLDVE